MDAGISCSPLGDYLSLGIAWMDFLKYRSKDPYEYGKIAAGVGGILVQTLTWSFDITGSSEGSFSDTMELKGGGEIIILSMFGLRGGYRYRKIDGRNGFGTGFGWYTPRFTLNYSFFKYLNISKQETHLFSLSFNPF